MQVAEHLRPRLHRLLGPPIGRIGLRLDRRGRGTGLPRLLHLGEGLLGSDPLLGLRLGLRTRLGLSHLRRLLLARLLAEQAPDPVLLAGPVRAEEVGVGLRH